MFVAAVERGRRQAQFVLPQDFAGEELHLWAFAVNAEGEASPTRYIPFASEAEATPNPTESTENKNTGNQREQKSPAARPTPQLQLALDFGSPPD